MPVCNLLTPMDAMANGPREQILYVTCTRYQPNQPDYLATVDVDPNSPTYTKVIHRTLMTNVGDEIHHMGWNSCASCPGSIRSHLVLPCLLSSRVYVIDTETNPRAPKLHTTVEPNELKKLGVTFPHTTHCLPTGQVLISTLGDEHGNGKGSFILIDTKTWKMSGKWSNTDVPFGYDYWYQPAHDVMISTEWGTPNKIVKGFNPQDVADGHYGHCLHVWSWENRTLEQTIDLRELGDGSAMPLEVRFLHDPNSVHGFVGSAVGSSIYHFYKEGAKWKADKVIQIPSKATSGWALPDMPGVVTDILLSLDDKYLYFSCWVHGDIRQYDVSDPYHPKLVGQVFLGGSICSDSSVKVTADAELSTQPDSLSVKGQRIKGAPQMLQLSLDGKRLYVTTSLFSVWDNQFYPEMTKEGGVMLKIDVDTVMGGLKLDKNFLIDFSNEPGGPSLAHEMRYPGGDCTSDIWLNQDQCCAKSTVSKI